jgi:DNA-binding NarL/FixJ family response regulator
MLDIRMPGMDGITCLELIRNNHPGVKVVMLSAYSDRDQVETALARGASAYIAKTVNPNDLPSALRQVFDGCCHEMSLLLIERNTSRDESINRHSARGQLADLVDTFAPPHRSPERAPG